MPLNLWYSGDCSRRLVVMLLIFVKMTGLPRLVWAEVVYAGFIEAVKIIRCFTIR